MLDGECWYGLCADHGTKFPLNKDSFYEADHTVNTTCNQMCPILISNKGRYIYSETGFAIKASCGEISISTEKTEIDIDGKVDTSEIDISNTKSADPITITIPVKFSKKDIDDKDED
jgi:hypothetical protein